MNSETALARQCDQPGEPLDDAIERTTELAALVVEDDIAEQLRLAAIVEKLGFQVQCATDGVDAIEKVERFEPRLIISDWHMPRMTGLQLCERLKRSATKSNTYVILVTGRNQTDDLVAGLSAGADDFVAKPYNAAELRARVKVGRRILESREGLERSNNSLLRKLNVQREDQRRIQDDLDEAARLQLRLLPPGRGSAEGFHFGHIFHPAESLAGDVVGCFPIGDRVIGFFHVDVVGHGASAALNSFALARTICVQSSIPGLLTTAGRPREPAIVVSDLNQHFLLDDQCDQYFTMIYGWIDSSTGQGRLCQAGHPHPLKLRPCGNVQKLGAGGFPVALLREAEYVDTEFTLERGERLFCYSDGVSEARNALGKMFGLSRLAGELVSTGNMSLADSLSAIEQSLQRWRSGQSWKDDVSLLAIERS